MTDDAIRARADERFAGRLEETGARDPREFYRERLRELRDTDEAAFRRAVDHYENRLIPAVAAEDSDPIAEWLEYGRMLAEMTIPGETVQIDPSGASVPYSPPVAADCLVLHLPTSTREKALAVGIPAELSAAQRAAFDLLVKHLTG
jgi:hypothetical protein